MPELPEVETTRLGLLQTLLGKRITGVTLHRDAIRTPIPPQFVQEVTGARVVNVERRAKYLVIMLDRNFSILAHLGMSGSFIVLPMADYTRRTHDHVVVALEGDWLLVYNDPRRFGVIDLVATHAAHTHPLLAALGPEPLSDDFSAHYLTEALAKRHAAIKPVIMDQRVVVGVGNIYASESLYLCKINPFMPANAVRSRVPALIDAIRTTLNAAIASGGSTLRNYVGTSNQAGSFQHRFRVYDRAGEPCAECGAALHFANQAGRATYWCDFCQKILKKWLKT